MFAVIYKFKLQPHQEKIYPLHWKKIADFFINHRGAIGSCLHKGDDGIWVAYSLWPNKATRDASWTRDNAILKRFPEEICQSMQIIQAIKEENSALENYYDELCLTVVEELLTSTKNPHSIIGPNIQLLPATLQDYPTIQNMARFYVYDRTPYMDWECPESGLFECIDFKHYFEATDEEAFLIRVNNEIAGFVLLDKMHFLEPVDWNMGEFFVLAKFQGTGIASEVAKQIFKGHSGKWSVAVMPENNKAVKFWRKIISDVSRGEYTEAFKTEDELRTIENTDPYAMNFFSFKV